MIEEQRLRSLIATGLLDTEGEARFDRLTRLASNALGAPIALVSLIDADRQWFKSRVGLEIDQTSRSVSFCDHAIRQPDQVMVVPDAKSDARFRDNPLVTGDPNLAFYAGAPLVTSEGHAIGTLCVIDTKARDDFSDIDKEILRDLAKGVMTEIEAAAVNRQADDLQVINRELQHRMGNLYAQVSSVVSLIGRSEADVASFMHRLNDNIRTMAQVQALFASNRYSSVPFRELVDSALLPFTTGLSEERLKISHGADLMVSERGAFMATLVLNELGTNAIKYGALASDIGSITLNSDKADVVRIRWTEVFPAKERGVSLGNGFGSRILREIAPRGLDGTASLEVHSNRLAYELTANPKVFSAAA